MLFSENIYFLILFTLPAAFNIIYNTYIRHVPRSYQDKSVELAECIIYCLFVFLANILILKKDVVSFINYMFLDKSNSVAVADFLEEFQFDYITFMIHYFVVNIATSIGIIFIWNSLLVSFYRCCCNIINELKGRPEEVAFGDVWRNLFETNELIDVNNHAVWIEKGGQLVTTGLIGMYQAPNESEKEIVVYNTERIKEIFDEDRKKSYRERIFKDSVYEYYNIEKDILIKFYSLSEYNKK